MNNHQKETKPAVAPSQLDRHVGRLLWDVARCNGENANGKCAARLDCRRHLEFADAGPLTMRFEAPTDAPLTEACELIIVDAAH